MAKWSKRRRAMALNILKITRVRQQLRKELKEAKLNNVGSINSLEFELKAVENEEGCGEADIDPSNLVTNDNETNSGGPFSNSNSVSASGEDPMKLAVFPKETTCLLCFGEDPNPLPLKGILPTSKGLKHPEPVEDDMRIIYLLKLVFQWSTAELNCLMKMSNGQSPRDWIHICQSCRLLVFEIQTLEDRIRDCRTRIKDNIVKSTPPASKIPMIRRIRNILSLQVKSERTNSNTFLKGDQRAEKLINLEMQKNGGFRNVSSHPEETDSIPDWNIQPENFFDEDSCDPTSGTKTVSRKRKVKEEDEAMAGLKNGHVLTEFFTCPYCSSDKPTTKEMNIVEFIPHLIHHHDNPMTCSECQIFLPRDPAGLEAHWQQCHSGVKATPPEERFLEKQVLMNLPKEEQNVDGIHTPLSFPENEQDESSIKCADCLNDSGLDLNFENMTMWKIHQAVQHPESARVSCPLCCHNFQEEEGERDELVKQHLQTVHEVHLFSNFWKSSICKFCGDRIPLSSGDVKRVKKGVASQMEKLHVISKHIHLINASFTCTQCSREFPDLKEFLEHSNSKSTCRHPPMHLNANATDLLCSHTKFGFACGLCSGGEKQVFHSVKSVMAHLTLVHSLYLKWKFDPANPSASENIIWKSIEVHIREMAGFIKTLDKMAEERESHKRSLLLNDTEKEKKVLNSKYLTIRPPIYACPTCPQLGKMNVDALIVHLVFHWRRPNKCTVCNLYLPFAPEGIDDHWKQHHPDMDLDSATSTLVKFEPVNFLPGKYFGCQSCPEMFASFRDRDEHHENTHGSCSPKLSSCSVCNESFQSCAEVRLHKALDHPEVASVSCFYCEEIFAAESFEGIQFLDYEAMQQHVSEKKDHPKAPSGTVCDIHACDLCGVVITEITKNNAGLRAHVKEKHGLMASRKPSMCFICNKGMLHLWEHLANSHGKHSNCICETCGEEMRPRTLPEHNLQKHNLLMEGYKELCCKEEGCNYKAVYPHNINRHVFVNHNKERQKIHQCSSCEKTFYRREHLRIHEERHNNKEAKPHQCELCGSSFAVRNDLYIHKRLSHLNQKFPSTNRKRTKRKEGPEEKSAIS